VRQRTDSLYESTSTTRSELSLLVEQYGDCTVSKMGTLAENETRALIRQMFFGDGQWEDVQADVSGCITSLAIEAEHHLFRSLSDNQAFKDLFSCITAEPKIRVLAVAEYLHRALPESDPADVFVDVFAEVTVHLLYDLFDGSLFVELPAHSDEPVTSASTALMLRASQEVPWKRRRLAGRHLVVAAGVPQLPLNQLLTEYCDFRQSRAPSLSERDKDYLRLLFLWGKDLRSISRASNLTYQRVQQIVTRATQALQDDLMAQASYRAFWTRLHRLCVVTPGVLSSAVMAVLGDQGQSIDATAVDHFLLHALKSDQALAWHAIGRARLQCCKGTEQQLDAIVAYVQEVRSRRRGPALDSDVSAVYMFILSHSELPSTSVQTVAADLLAAVSPPDVADQLEALLTRLGIPSHFADLARGLDDASSGEGISADYVHAVLCRDSRFAWAGLGTYALTAWGYPRATSALGVILHMIRVKGSGVTMSEVNEFMFVKRNYNIKPSSVRLAMRAAEGSRLKRIGAGVWDELRDPQQDEDNEVTEHE
jgi:hypothetical protein